MTGSEWLSALIAFPLVAWFFWKLYKVYVHPLVAYADDQRQLRAGIKRSEDIDAFIERVNR